MAHWDLLSLQGVYALELSDLSPEAIVAAYETQSRRSGYGGGAAVILEADGLGIHGQRSHDLPPGAAFLSRHFWLNASGGLCGPMGAREGVALAFPQSVAGVALAFPLFWGCSG